jgi:hypothetical protein
MAPPSGRGSRPQLAALADEFTVVTWDERARETARAAQIAHLATRVSLDRVGEA